MPFDALLLAVNSAAGTDYAPHATAAIGMAVVAAGWAYRRAQKLDRSVLAWTALCFVFGLLGMAIFWVITRREAQRWAFETIPDNRRMDVSPPLSTWQPNWDAVSETLPDTSSSPSPAPVADATAKASTSTDPKHGTIATPGASLQPRVAMARVATWPKITAARVIALSTTIAAIAAVVLLTASLRADGQSNSQPDRVVNVVLRCTYPVYTTDGNRTVQHQDYSGDICSQLIAPEVVDGSDRAQVLGLLNAHQQVTVRTSAGSAYTVDATVDLAVAIGDVWPPETK